MNESQFQKLQNSKPPLVITSSVAVKALVFVGIISGALFGFWLAGLEHGNPLNLLLFPIGSGGIAAVLSYTSIRTKLILEQESFTVKELFSGSATYAWKDVSSFFPHASVISSCVARGSRQSFTITFVYEISKHKHEFDIPSNSLTLSQYAELLNHWRGRAIAAKIK